MMRVMPQARNGSLIVEGYGARVAVERGRLTVEDGICDDRRRRRFSRATAGLKRLVVLGHTGFITLEALRWLHDLRAAFVHIDADGQVVVTSGPVALDDARVRRAQALASTNGVGIRLARELVRRKLEGQLALLGRLPRGYASAPVVQSSLDNLARATTPAQLRLYEAAAGKAYFEAWGAVPVRFVRKDEPRVPDHWRTFGQRSSPLTASPRLAANPANALLNYVFAVLETEARIAAQALGLDPGMGVLHADQPSRDSLALDLMEPVRPAVDTYVLEMLSSQIFRSSDFFETRQGVCRLLPPLTHALAETAPDWARRVAPIAEWAAAAFASAAGSRVKQVPTPLTQVRRSLGRDGIRRQKPKQPKVPKPVVVAACRMCGEILPSLRRFYCDNYRPVIKAESLATFQASGPAALARLMAEGRDPTHGGEAARKRAASLARRQEEAAEWERRHGSPDPEEFRLGILPQLQGVPLRKMAKVTGLSIRYCSLIRRGLHVPHPRQWEVLEKVSKGLATPRST